MRLAVTQYEFVGAVTGISERFLLPLLEGLLRSFPFHGDTRHTPLRSYEPVGLCLDRRNAHAMRLWAGGSFLAAA